MRKRAQAQSDRRTKSVAFDHTRLPLARSCQEGDERDQRALNLCVCAERQQTGPRGLGKHHAQPQLPAHRELLLGCVRARVSDCASRQLTVVLPLSLPHPMQLPPTASSWISSFQVRLCVYVCVCVCVCVSECVSV